MFARQARINMFSKARQFFNLTLLFLTCFLPSCNQHGQMASKEMINKEIANNEKDVVLGDTIERLVEQLSQEIEFHSTEGIGYAGERTHQYDLSDSLWHMATTEQLAYLALSHPSPVVRLSASYGLMERDPHVAAEIAIKGVLDTAMCEVVSGCCGEWCTVSEERILKLSINRKWYGLSVKDSIRLDSAVLYKPYFDKYDRDLMDFHMTYVSPRPQYYMRLKELYQKEHCVYALLGIAKYQRADDKQLLLDMIKKAIRLSQKKFDENKSVIERAKEQLTREVRLLAITEEDVYIPPLESSENDASVVSYVIIRSVSFWPDEELVRAVQPLRKYHRHLFDVYLTTNI